MKVLKRILIPLLIMSLLFAVPVQAASPKKTVKKKATAFCWAIREYDQKAIFNSFLPPNMRKSIEYVDKGYGLDKTIRKLQRKYFDFKIKKVKVKGSTATVKIKFTYYDGEDLFDAAFWYAVKKHINKTATPKSALTTINKYAKSHLKKYPAADYITDATITLKYRKYNGKWLITNMSSALSDVVNCCAVNVIDSYA